MLAQAKTLLDIARKLAGQVDAIKSDQRGVSAIEFSFFAGLLSFGMLNTVDISIYVYKRMQLENATQMGAQAAWKTCDPSQGYLPATTKCPGLADAVKNAVKSTSLGTNVSLQTGSPAEYYCLNSLSGALESPISSSTSPPSACPDTSMQPADYIKITTTFAYAPLFPGVTVASAFPTPITKTSIMRLN